MNAARITVLIVDDHAVVRSGYRAYLQEVPGFTVVAEAQSAEEAYLRYKELCPDVIIMDLMMPSGSGIEASRKILLNDPSAKILIFSMYASPVLIQQALDVGVIGAVGKQCDPNTLREAALSVSRGKPYLDGAIAQSLVFTRYNKKNKVLNTLSPREFEIFLMLISGANCDESAEALSLSTKTIANRASMIRKKLGVTTDIQLLKLAVEAGVAPWLGSVGS